MLLTQRVSSCVWFISIRVWILIDGIFILSKCLLIGLISNVLLMFLVFVSRFIDIVNGSFIG